jgi:CheY-like chemotaxis protein/signal transduction histidine kinase
MPQKESSHAAEHGRDRPELLLGIAVSVALVFLVDCTTPLGWAEWILYVVPVGLCLLANRPSLALVTGAACSVLLVAGYAVSPPSSLVDIAIVNRGLGFAVLWCVVVLTQRVVVARGDLARQKWLREAQAELSMGVRGERSIEQLGERVLELLCRKLGADAGALYVLEQTTLKRCGAFALNADAPASFAVGEGLVGQVIKSDKAQRITEVPDDYFRVRSALGERRPRELVLAPTRTDEKANGVVELGFFSPPDEADLDLLTQSEELIGVALRSARYRSQLEELLLHTQRQTEELQSQQEELRVSNEELEEQGRILREQQASLEQQQVDLEQVNVRLEEHAELLTQRQSELLRVQRELADKATELEAANQYKSEFLANMSHELRTPLNSSLILAKLLSDNAQGNLTEEQCRFARSIYAAGNELLALINDILDLSKIEAGKMEVRFEPVRITRVFEALESTFRPLADNKGIALALSRDATVPELITTDVQRLQQILKNLLSNAVKFTERGEVRAHFFLTDGRHLSIAVSDTGIGIPESQQRAVFEAFRQADGTTSRRFGGTGLGLSISRELAALLGGKLSLASEPGRGSTFTLSLPLTPPNANATDSPGEMLIAPARTAPSELAAAAAAAVTAHASARREERAGPAVEDDRNGLAASDRTLLIIEDDPEFQLVLRDLARERGYKAVVAGSADEGLEEALLHRPQAIVLDLGLPDHSGLTVLDRLKRSPLTRHIPVQVVSGLEQTRTALEMGAAGYLLKPVRREELLAALDALETRSSSHMRSVLVVEDDERQRESVCALLTTPEVSTLAVPNVAAALEQLRLKTYDCVVLDLQLPDGSGFELLEQMSSNGTYSFPPVIVYTGKDVTQSEESKLRRYSSSIIIKGARSPERLLDEVTLFLHQVEMQLPPERQRMLAQARSREAIFEGRVVMLVEDDVRNIFALTSVLEPRGCILRTARNGREAVDALSSDQKVDIILMDIMMPEMDGYTAMRELRRREGFAKTPIIALTAKAMRDDQERCMEAGANDYISKPINVDKLLSLLRVWMPKRAE